jgi:2-dehydro-3-deoxyphosphogluconate aldolase / (4S)-4-hydroxy-2-oxoglutarate aldolase
MTTDVPRGVVAVIRTADASHALTLARGLAGTSVASIEVTMTVPDAINVIAQLVSEGVTRVGAGTVRTVEQVEGCIAAGAEFIVSPHLDPELVAAAVHGGVAVVPGTLTPSEILAAIRLGASAAKIFPIHSVGGLRYIEAITEPLPDVRLVVSGGIAPADVPAYLEAGAWAACLGSSLWQREDVERGDVDAVRAFASGRLDEAAACGSA